MLKGSRRVWWNNTIVLLLEEVRQFGPQTLSDIKEMYSQRETHECSPPTKQTTRSILSNLGFAGAGNQNLPPFPFPFTTLPQGSFPLSIQSPVIRTSSFCCTSCAASCTASGTDSCTFVVGNFSSHFSLGVHVESFPCFFASETQIQLHRQLRR